MKFQLSVMLIVIFSGLLSGCAASRMLVAQNNGEEIYCDGIDHEIQIADKRITEIDETDNTLRTVRDVILGGVSLIFPPLAIMNAALLFNDSPVADFAEKDVLENRNHDLMLAANNKGCGFMKARVPEQSVPVKPAPRV